MNIPNFIDAQMVDKNGTGNIIYDKTTNQLKVNIHGTFKVIQVV